MSTDFITERMAERQTAAFRAELSRRLSVGDAEARQLEAELPKSPKVLFDARRSERVARLAAKWGVDIDLRDGPHPQGSRGGERDGIVVKDGIVYKDGVASRCADGPPTGTSRRPI